MPDTQSHIQAVSVIIPAYNAAGSIRAAVESVLAQTFSDYEIIIVNDASPDDLAGALAGIADPRLKLINHEFNQGAAAARNTGVLNAQGVYAAFLDADDIWYPEKLARQYAFMTGAMAGKGVRASCTSFAMRRSNGRVTNRLLSSAKDSRENLFDGCFISPGTTLMAERRLFSEDETGLFPLDLRRLEDWDWLLTYISAYRLGIIEDVLSEVRVSGYPVYETVRQSAEILRARKTKFVKENFGFKAAKQFRAGLEIECAAAAFHQKRYGLAIKHITSATINCPPRLWRLVLRIAVKFRTSDHGGL